MQVVIYRTIIYHVLVNAEFWMICVGIFRKIHHLQKITNRWKSKGNLDLITSKFKIRDCIPTKNRRYKSHKTNGWKHKIAGKYRLQLRHELANPPTETVSVPLAGRPAHISLSHSHIPPSRSGDRFTARAPSAPDGLSHSNSLLLAASDVDGARVGGEGVHDRRHATCNTGCSLLFWIRGPKKSWILP